MDEQKTPVEGTKEKKSTRVERNIPVKTNLIQFLAVFGLVVLAVVLGFMAPSLTEQPTVAATLSEDDGGEEAILAQQKTGMREQPHIVTKIYLRNQLLGVIQDKTLLDKELAEVYNADYAEKFPDTKIGLGEDVYSVDQLSYYDYEDIDDQIIGYLEDNDLFSVLTNKITFSNGAVIYVKDVDMFTRVREQFLLNFISEDTYRTLASNKTVVPLQTYGEQDIDLKVLETMEVSEGLAPEDRIFTTEEEIMNFFDYGYDTVEKEYYTVVAGDTVQGVVSKAGHNLTPTMLVSINPDILTSTEQILEPGTELNITYFDSPIEVQVTKERLAEENVYPEATKYIYDDTIDVGTRTTEVEEVVGKRNVRYHDTYINGILQDGKEISSVVTKEPVQRVVRVGTRENSTYIITPGTEFNTGTGSLWYPVANPIVACAYGCYYGHNGTDFMNRYDEWGLVYAADAGTIVMNSYSSTNGYFYIIDHHNGMYTYYGHMRVPGWYGVGTDVQQGEAIGNIGMTGLATAPHVHFMIAYGGMPMFGPGVIVDPCSVLGC